MFNLKIYIARRRKSWERSTAEFNKLLKQALHETGEYWVREYLPRHFRPGASQRYNYAPRSGRWQAIKHRARMGRQWRNGREVLLPKPVAPLVWTGQLRDEVLGRPVSDFNIKTSGATGKARVHVPVKIPHPISKYHTGELTKLLPSEAREMARMAKAILDDLLDHAPSTTETVTIGG